MAKFLDKKERAIDFKLTPYGKHKLSVGNFKPTYYAFFDNGVVYDIDYTTSSNAKAVYTQIEGTPALLTGKTIILEDSVNQNSHTLTFDDTVAPGSTTKDTIGINGLSTAATIATNIVTAVNLAQAAGNIAMTATQDATQVNLTMDTKGPVSTGKKITGTTLSSTARLATATVFRLKSEQQNEIHDRIKNKTQYLEGILSFEELENSVPAGSLARADKIKVDKLRDLTAGHLSWEEIDMNMTWLYGGDSPRVSERDGEVFSAESYYVDTYRFTHAYSMFDLDINPSKHIPRPDVFQFDSAIGDAKFEGRNTQAAPAWKVVACQGEIIKSTQKDTAVYIPSEHKDTLSGKEYNIPQLNIDLYYKKIVGPPKSVMWSEDVSEALNETSVFADGNVIRLENHDLVIYADEVNTELLTENFDIEVFTMNEEAGVNRASIGTIAFNPSVQPVAGDIIEISDGTYTRKFQFVNSSGTAPLSTDTVAVVLSSAYKEDGMAIKNRYGTLYNLISAINNEYGTREQGYPTEPNVGTDSDGNNLADPTDTWDKGRCGTSSWVYDQTDGLKKCWHLGADAPTTPPEWEFPVRASVTLALGDESGAQSLIATLTSPSSKNRTITYTPATADSNVTVSGFKNGIEYKITELERKHFHQTAEQIVDGLMKLPNPVSKDTISTTEVDTNTVEYYFDVMVDSKMDKKLGCQCANAFNKNSYYVDIDFECEEEQESEYYDIYGSVTVPEICVDDSSSYGFEESCEDENLED